MKISERTHPRQVGRVKRHVRIRKRVVGTAERPRMAVFRSHQHLYVQIIDDLKGHTLVGCSTLRLRSGATLRGPSDLKTGGNREAAKWLGQLVAQEAKKQGITQVVFDRGGYEYHGRVQVLADAARQGGLQF